MLRRWAVLIMVMAIIGVVLGWDFYNGSSPYREPPAKTVLLWDSRDTKRYSMPRPDDPDVYKFIASFPAAIKNVDLANEKPFGPARVIWIHPGVLGNLSEDNLGEIKQLVIGGTPLVLMDPEGKELLKKLGISAIEIQIESSQVRNVGIGLRYVNGKPGYMTIGVARENNDPVPALNAFIVASEELISLDIDLVANDGEEYSGTFYNLVDAYPRGSSILRHDIFWVSGFKSFNKYDLGKINNEHKTVPGEVLQGNGWNTLRGKPGVKAVGNGSIILDSSPSSPGFFVDGKFENHSDYSQELTRWLTKMSGDYSKKANAFKSSTSIRFPTNKSLQFYSYNYAIFDHWAHRSFAVEQTAIYTVRLPGFSET